MMCTWTVVHPSSPSIWTVSSSFNHSLAPYLTLCTISHLLLIASVCSDCSVLFSLYPTGQCELMDHRETERSAGGYKCMYLDPHFRPIHFFFLFVALRYLLVSLHPQPPFIFSSILILSSYTPRLLHQTEETPYTHCALSLLLLICIQY